MMLLINWWLSILFTVLLLVLFVMVSRSTAGNDWGDALSGLMYQQARNLLLYMSGPASSSRRSKNWRPQLMVVTHIREKRTGDSPTRFLHESLIRLAGQMKKGEGLTMVAALLEGEPAYVHPQVCDEIQDDLEAFMRNEGIYGFARCCVTRTLVDGFDTVVQMAGVGTMKPNTLICQWPDGLEDMCYDDAREHVERFRVVATSKKALIVVKGANALPSNQARYRGYIDVWWVVNVHDGGLLILLPHLLWLHKVWHHCQLRLFVVMTSPGDNPVKLKRRAEEHLDHERVDATVEVVDLSASSHGVYDFTLDHNARNQLLMTLNNPHTLSVALRQDSDYRLSVARKSHLAEIFRSVSPSGEVPKTNSDSLMRSPDHFTPHTSPERPDTNDRDHGDINGSHDELRCDDGGSTDGIVLDTIEMSQVDLSPPCIEHRPDEAFIANCMQIAVQFNALLRQRSKDSKLVVLNFPPLHKMDDADFINYTATLTNNLQPVLLVKGTGQEIITSYS